MKKYILSLTIPAVVLLTLSGCSTSSKTASGSGRNNGDQSHDPDQMRVVTEGAIFQPLTRVEMPKFQGLQTPLAGSGRQRLQSTSRSITLPKYTPVKVLDTTKAHIVVQLADGRRGFLPTNSIAKESVILAAAQPAMPLDGSQIIDPATGLPYPESTGSLYLPEMNAADAPVDQAMLNNVDSIPLPESELQQPSPEAEEVDGVILRKANASPVPQPDLANSPGSF